MKRSAIVLAGGFSNRFGQDKGLLRLGDRPLILHILDSISPIVDEVLIVVNSVGRKRDYVNLDPTAEIVIDRYKIQSPVVGTLTGFESAKGEYSLLLPCDTPFVSPKVAELLLDACIGSDAAIPKWSGGHIEPLQAAYHTRSALTASKKALRGEKSSMHLVISYLKKICYLPTSSFRQIDPQLMTFFNINSPEDMVKAERVLQTNIQRRSKSAQQLV
ncbi:MAG: molybdenum cofactor guanylyltransferase [Candidatus Bathyarchaeota archaeon]|nr:MAG: molybdenum cofactor guanylyltransferase [Candidatus Bathyarchaeota archaeon]